MYPFFGRAAAALAALETDPDPAVYTAACPACLELTTWRTVGRDKGRSTGFEIDCPCTEPPR